jgi:hypothetical protein
MAERVVIKKDWNKSAIKVGFSKHGVYIEGHIDKVRMRMRGKLLDQFPPWVQKYFKKRIEQAFDKAWDDVIEDMKSETKAAI